MEHIPNSVRLWKETVNLETNPADVRIILSRAVEVIPLSVELWLALARLETPERAKAVLNKARKAIPTSHDIWIAAGRLLEQEAYASADTTQEQKDKQLAMVDKTIEAGVRELRRHQVFLTREQWLKEAEKCEEDGSMRTCEAIVKATVSMEIEEEDRLDTWMGDAESVEGRGKVGTARAILAYALKVFPDRRDLWRKAAELEKSHGTRESLNAMLERAVQHCPQAETLWLMWAKEKWIGGDVPAARDVLAKAFDANPESEQIWLAAVKIEAENKEYQAARDLLVRARTVADTERVSRTPGVSMFCCLPSWSQIWMKSAVFERQHGQVEAAMETVKAALVKFPKFPKLYMIQGQIYQSQSNYVAARAIYAAGMKQCPKDVTLWILASRLEELDGKSIKARALLERARMVNPASEQLWAETVGVEERSGGAAQAKAMLSRGAKCWYQIPQVISYLISIPGLQECPESGLLWTMSVWSEPRPARKTRSADALRKTKDNPLVICTVARIFWSERKIEKAREWFGRALAQDSDLGDVWAWWLKFERQHGTEETRQEVINRCVAAEPHHSPVWQSLAKDDKNLGKGPKEILEQVADVIQ